MLNRSAGSKGPLVETKRRMSARKGKSRIDVEVWQIQAYPAAGDPTDLTTFELICDGEVWSLRSSG